MKDKNKKNQTIVFINPPIIIGSYSLVGKKRRRGQFWKVF